jgi:hypothetical protein
LQTTSQAYKDAINAPTRKIVPKAVIDLADPDLDVSAVAGDYDASYSFPDQLYDRDAGYSGEVYATGEHNRWLLDGSFSIFPDDPLTRGGEQGVIGDTLSGADCSLNKSLEIDISGVETLQVVTVAPTGVLADGYPVRLSLDIYSSSSLLYSGTAEPEAGEYYFEGFTVTQPTKLVLTVTEWSLPNRYFRFVEFLPGFVEVWGGETIFRLDVIQKADFSNLTIPYASASITIDNTSKRFDPANKAGVFKSVVARQPVPLFLGVQTGDSAEYVAIGVYYQQNLGWQLQNDGLTIQWDLIDIIGLLADRKFELAGTQPTTLAGWVAEIVGQLGATFEGHYTIDGDLGSTALTCSSSDLDEITCGDLLRFICQASNTFPVSDPVTGYLHIKALNNTTQDYVTMRMQNTVANSRANTDIAFLSFDINGTLYNVPGTAEASDTTVNVKNPFITTANDAAMAAQVILTQYGGDVLELRARGDMSREVGDMVSVEVIPGVNVSARIFEQQLTLDNGVMTNVPLKCLQANGGTLYTDVIVINESGSYQMPAGVTECTLVLIGGGDGGDGGDGATLYYLSANKDSGAGGAGGKGGKVYTIPLEINDGQQFSVSIGAGGTGGKGGTWSYRPRPADNKGAAGAAGSPTAATFSATYTSADGVRMPAGYADLLTNMIFALDGQNGLTGQRDGENGKNGKPNTGFGGAGGDGGGEAVVVWLTPKDVVPSYELPPEVVERIMRLNGFDPAGGMDQEKAIVAKFPTNGKNGGNGGSGCCLIFYTR